MRLEPGVFKLPPKQMAASLKCSVLRSNKTKGSKFSSAMSMLSFAINRSGRNLSDADWRRLQRAKDELRVLFGRPRQGIKLRRKKKG